MSAEEENVQVVVRIRPMQANEKKNGDIPCVKAISQGKEVQVKVGPLEAQNYRCHKCFNPDTTQDTFFEECGITDMINSTMEGFRTCVFAYGQTGAGKTYSMFGGNKGMSHHDKHGGLIVRSLQYIYNRLDQLKLKYRIKLSCMEIYQEHVFDLFAEERERVSLNIREHNVDGFFLEGLKYIECKDFTLACSVLDMAVKNRQVGGHELNHRSSRSHCLTDIYLEIISPQQTESSGELNQKKLDINDTTLEDLMTENYYDTSRQHALMVRGKISLIDLAGSERLKNTNSTGKVLQEAGFINRSLYVLGKVIAGLVRTSGDLNHKDVPYRDSKLTKLLISSLGGNSRTLLIACVSEAKGSQAETLRTLKFSMSCARIRNKPVKFLDPQEKLILDLKQEIKRLKVENKKLRSTLLTAPVSSSHYYNNVFSDHEDEGNSNSPSYHRAMSAHGQIRSNAPPAQQDHARRLKNQRTNLGEKKKKFGPNSKMKSSQSELLAKYPQLNSIIQRDPKINKSIEKLESGNRLRPQFKSILEQIPNQSKNRDSFEGNPTDGVKKRLSVDLLDEMIHRRAPGPLIFKDKASPVASVRESRQNPPADNYVRRLDKELERQNSWKSSGTGDDNEAMKESEVIDAERLIAKKKSKSKKVPPKPLKPSPYIAHLIKKKPDKGKDNKGGNKKANEVQLSEVAKVSNSGLTASSSPKLALENLHDSIEKAFEEFGVSRTERTSGVKSKIDKDSNKLSYSRLDTQEKANFLNASTLKYGHNSTSSSPALPPIPSSNTSSNMKATKERNIPSATKLPQINLRGNLNRDDENELSTGALNILDNNLKVVNVEGASVKAEVVNTPDRLKRKVQELENSLSIQRMEMEDNPGHVTNEMEEKYNSLKLETQLMKIELTRMTGETFEFESSSKNAKLEKSSSLLKESTEYEDDYDNYYDEEFADEDEKDKRKHEASDMLQPDAEPHSNSPKEKIDSQSTPQKNLQYTDKQMPDKLPTPTSVTEISSGLSEKHTIVDAEEEEDAYGNEEFDDFED